MPRAPEAKTSTGWRVLRQGNHSPQKGWGVDSSSPAQSYRAIGTPTEVNSPSSSSPVFHILLTSPPPPGSPSASSLSSDPVLSQWGLDVSVSRQGHLKSWRSASSGFSSWVRFAPRCMEHIHSSTDHFFTCCVPGSMLDIGDSSPSKIDAHIAQRLVWEPGRMTWQGES